MKDLLGSDPPFSNKIFSKLIGDCPYTMPDELLPKADCRNCEYDKLPHPKSHCYMFLDSPGEKCGQFRQLEDLEE